MRRHPGDGVRDDAAASVEQDARELGNDAPDLRLADRDADRIAWDLVLSAGHGFARVRSSHAKGRNSPIRAPREAERSRPRYDTNAFSLRLVELMRVPDHLTEATTVDHGDVDGAELRAFACHVDSRVPPPHHENASKVELVGPGELHRFDPRGGAIHAGPVFAGKPKPRVGTQADADEHRVVRVQ